jgi:hypothetical protein
MGEPRHHPRIQFVVALAHILVDMGEKLRAVVWRWVWRWGLKNEKGDWTKPPYQPASPNRHAKNNDPQTWGDYTTAIAAYNDKTNDLDGIGLMRLRPFPYRWRRSTCNPRGACRRHQGWHGREALLYHLLYEVDCSQVNLRQIPHTDALIEQKLESVSTEQGWWLDILLSGILPGDWNGEGLAPAQLLFDHYVEHSKKKGVSRRVIETSLGLFLNKMVGDDNLQRSKETYLLPPPQNPNNARETKRGLVYQFPPLQFCRERFAERFDEPLAWYGDDGDWLAAGTQRYEEPGSRG